MAGLDRAVYSSSPNDYKYTNHDKKINIYDEEKNIIGQYHPKERNRSGSFKDLHLLQEVYYNTLKGDRFGLNAWYINSNRELPMLTTDYGDETAFENRQREQTFRGVLSWDHIKEKWKVGVKGGYIHTWMAYDYRREVAPDNWASMTRSRSKINTFYGQAEAEYSPGRNGSSPRTYPCTSISCAAKTRTSSFRMATKPSSDMTRGVSSSPVLYRPNGSLSSRWACRWSCARRCRATNGLRSSRHSSSTD